MACGLDIGTSNIVSARKTAAGEVLIKRERDAFIYIGKWKDVRNKLNRTNIPYGTIDEKTYIIGNDAYSYANIFGDVPLDRPMHLGLLNPKEKDSLPIMKTLIDSLLGPPQCENEVCVYVVPAEPINVHKHTVYHEDVLASIIKSLGYWPLKIHEAVALAYSGLLDDGLTGISCSFGGGMCNVSVLYQGLTALDFSVTKAGDYIDENAAGETDNSIAHMTSLKEDPEFSLLEKYKTREALAIESYYRFVIKNILAQIAHLFTTSKSMPQFKEPIKIVCGGGTSMVKGFIEVFRDEFEAQEFPINVSDVIIVGEPLFAVAKGALSEALIEEEER